MRVAIEKKIIAASIMLGLLMWVFDAVIDSYFFRHGPFSGQLITQIRFHEVYMRMVILVSFIIFGIVIARMMARLRKAQAVYEEAELRRLAIFNTISDAVFLHPLQEEGFAPFIDVNDAACSWYGFTREEFRSLTASDITKRVDADRHSLAKNRRMLLEAGQLVFETTHITKAGSEFPVEINSSVVNLTGRPMILAVVRDITKRKHLEKERLVFERQVQHAQKLESLGVLAGGIAHDFNNLLMAILGNADLALDEISSVSPARSKLRDIEKAVKRAAELARQMLAYSGKGNFVIEPINLNELVREMAHMLQVSISKKAVLKFNFADKLPLIDGDATQLRQIIMNLITNASDAISERSGVIAISTGAMNCSRDYLHTTTIAALHELSAPMTEGVYAYVEVADTGCGMDLQSQQKLFDPFYTTKFTGRGLGMAVVQGIVRGHKGTIKVYSEVGKGTNFKILLPVSESAVQAHLLEEEENQDGSWQGRGTVLVADDEEAVCAVAKLMLEKIGFDVLTAADGREALRIFETHKDAITCVLLDLTMPHLDGEEVFRKIRLIGPNVKVVISSGYNESDATQRFIGKGLAGFIQKPYTYASLAAKIREVMDPMG